MEAPAADSIAISRGTPAQYYDLRLPANAAALFL
jgi:hypothetical protein